MKAVEGMRVFFFSCLKNFFFNKKLADVYQHSRFLSSSSTRFFHTTGGGIYSTVEYLGIGAEVWDVSTIDALLCLCNHINHLRGFMKMNRPSGQHSSIISGTYVPRFMNVNFSVYERELLWVLWVSVAVAAGGHITKIINHFNQL